MAEYAVYLVGGERERVRVFSNGVEECEANLTPLEAEASSICSKGSLLPEYDGIGWSKDPFKEFKTMLASHYGSARMVEAHYEWEPYVVY